MRFMMRGTLLVLLIMVMAAGCATNQQQVENTIASTHQIALRLDENLGSTVTKLNETAADLRAQVDTSTQEMQRLNGLVQESQRKLEEVERKLDTLTATAYRQWNLSGEHYSRRRDCARPAALGAGSPCGYPRRPDRCYRIRDPASRRTGNKRWRPGLGFS